MTPRLWYLFRLPRAYSAVPASSEVEARAVLRANAYRDAPIERWACIGTMHAPREDVAPLLLALVGSRLRLLP